jgi:hypothetical protein
MDFERGFIGTVNVTSRRYSFNAFPQQLKFDSTLPGAFIRWRERTGFAQAIPPGNVWGCKGGCLEISQGSVWGEQGLRQERDVPLRKPVRELHEAKGLPPNT